MEELPNFDGDLRAKVINEEKSLTKVLRGNSPFIPFSVRIYILEFIRLGSFKDRYQTLPQIVDYFGYFKKDQMRKIYQVFRNVYCMISELSECGRIPSLNTKSLHIICIGKCEADEILRRYDLKKIRNLRIIGLVYTGSFQIFDQIANHPKIDHVTIMSKESLDLKGLERMLIKKHQGFKRLRVGFWGNYRELDISESSFRRLKETTNLEFFQCNILLSRSCSRSSLGDNNINNTIDLFKLREFLFSCCNLNSSFFRNFPKYIGKVWKIKFTECEIPKNLDIVFSNEFLRLERVERYVFSHCKYIEENGDIVNLPLISFGREIWFKKVGYELGRDCLISGFHKKDPFSDLLIMCLNKLKIWHLLLRLRLLGLEDNNFVVEIGSNFRTTSKQVGDLISEIKNPGLIAFCVRVDVNEKEYFEIDKESYEKFRGNNPSCIQMNFCPRKREK